MTNRGAGAVRRPQLLAAVVLSACVGLLGGSTAAWAIYHRLGPAERVINQPVASGSGGGSTLSGIAADRSPSVVSILTRPVTPDGLAGGPSGFVNGFVAAGDGLIVTSARAVQGATKLRVALADGQAFDALVAASDARHGVVVLRAVGAHDLTPLPFAAKPPRPGDFGVVVARPSLHGLRIAAGTVSSEGRSIGDGADALSDASTLSAVGNAEDEGAPLLDDRGAVIGLITEPGPGSAATSELVALSGRAASDLVDRVSRGGPRSRPTLGAESVILDPATAAAASLPSGALIRSVLPGSAAAEAGIVRGDIVTAVDGSGIDGDHPLDPAGLRLDPGQRVTLTVFTRGDKRNVALTVGSE